MNSKHKEQLLQSFQDYLEQIDEPQIDEAGADAVDLYSLFTQLGALKSEIRLESRQWNAATKTTNARLPWLSKIYYWELSS
jgi:hypothetical protein